MAITATIERKTEDAWIQSLQARDDLAGITIRRASDADVEVVYPCIIVNGGTTGISPLFQNTQVDAVLVDLVAMTYIPDDRDAAIVDGLIGAIRDLFISETILTELSGVNNYTARGVVQDGDTFSDDERNIRRRTITIKTIGVAQDAA